ncbi:unnamed protein product, partial [Rotaria sordida]
MSSVLLRDFLYQLSICSEKAACIARHIRFMHGDFNSMIEEKQLDENHQHLDADYKTLADVIIQEVIKRDLRRIYPALTNHIYGEEDGSLKLNSSDEKIFIDVTGTQEDIHNLLKKLFNNKSAESTETLAEIVSSSSNITLSNQCKQSFEKIPHDIFIDLSNIGIWIDPVDGTQQYINGTDGFVDSNTGIIQDGLPAALVLIGCFDLKDGRAVLGVINRAFNEKIDEYRWKGLIYWGTVLSNAKFNNLEDVYKRHENNNQRVLLHGSADVNTFDNILNDWTKMEVSACGNKLLSIALKQANIYLVTKSAAYNWDLCAAHAIIQSINGQILDLRQVINYYQENRTKQNVNLSQFEIIYNNIKPNKFQPKDYACKPFIAYHNQQDLIDMLSLLICLTIYYTRHILNGANLLLNSNKYFPSRFLNLKNLIMPPPPSAVLKKKTTSKNPPFLSQEFLIQNHGDIASSIIMILTLGAVFHVTSPYFTVFFGPRHNATNFISYSTVPATLFNYGYKDLAMLFAYTLVCITVHAIWQEYVLDKLNKKLHLSKSKNAKFFESGQLILFYVISVLWALKLFQDESYFQSGLEYLWRDYPYIGMTIWTQLFFIIQISYWLHNYPELYIQKVRKEDIPSRIFYTSLHLITILYGYLTRFWRISLILLTIHYFIEIFHHLSRLAYFYTTAKIHSIKAKSISKYLLNIWYYIFIVGRLISIVLIWLTFWFGLKSSSVNKISYTSTSLTDSNDTSNESIMVSNFNTPTVRLFTLVTMGALQFWLVWNFIQ